MAHKSARMKTKGGDVRFVPFFQIEYWERRKILEKLGYKFITEAGKKEFEAWKIEKAKAAVVAQAKSEAGPTMSDGGIADAHMGVGGKSTAEAIVPDKEPEEAPPETVTREGDDVIPVDDVEVREVL